MKTETNIPNVETNAKSETLAEKGQTKGNPYELFRETVKATVYATVVKTRDTSVSFNWSLGKVISACAEACKLSLTETPADFKRIVKFEFEKLRDTVATNGSYELVRSREDFVLAEGEMKGRLTNVHLKLIPLEEQLIEARKLYSRLEVKAADANLSAEKRSALRKRIRKVIVVIDHTDAEIKRQQKLIAEVSAEAEAKKS